MPDTGGKVDRAACILSCWGGGANAHTVSQPFQTDSFCYSGQLVPGEPFPPMRGGSSGLVINSPSVTRSWATSIYFRLQTPKFNNQVLIYLRSFDGVRKVLWVQSMEPWHTLLIFWTIRDEGIQRTSRRRGIVPITRSKEKWPIRRTFPEI